ncbi:DNA primase [Candidatus Woesebacteria bacterium RIFCSPHIGHO2_01_FULL_39_17]|uniref:DNA primase n=3 Tax=Candidatus Woeseibacteriota TaxID=1752722 RepID=A0A0G0QTD5_9BACT|nr:MAG: primase protein [Microgenomates group bacterium GW2011_GWC1_38_12]KKQ93612.1 MAG: primase protein [Candidatus Woesebacteria bacterium GW2011_GWB1_39_10b]KKR13610.1 MAG: primase protein [Candidatus Woesebacteria bacterium GW2011_GWA1_39_21b]OGM23091.1 MAG: DNA primase [Candidatus Woesebacteria bacterium RIFCSPHIGHO2_01_FULL_39_17]OGM61542.1 MAG: DNA primase [Candidatus Woesebacteria bacterium RIFCSPLOWO2_01_FULL_39_14]
MADQVDEVKSKIDIVSLISEYVELKRAGRNYKALCPFHSEKTPSFMVSPEVQIFKCFGCQKGGDALTFLQEYEGMDFPEALKFLAERVGVKLTRGNFVDRGSKERLYEINSYALRFYHFILLNHNVGKIALDYLKNERGIKLDTIKTFQIGYSPDTPLALKKYLIDKKKISLRDLERVGLIYSKNGATFDRFRGRIIFPLHDHRGNIVGFSGRVLPKARENLAKYINSPETEIYHKSKILFGLHLTKGEIKKKKEAVIVEGELDAISSWQVGVKNVVAIKGSALTEEQARLLARFSGKLILALDADFAGSEAARRGIEIAERFVFDIRVAKLSGFKDPDEAARKDPEKLKKGLEKASGVWDFMIDLIFERYPGLSGSDKAKISREIVPIISAIRDKIVQAHYIGIVAKKLGVSLEAVTEQVDRIVKKDVEKPKLEALVKPPTKTRRELLEERFLAVVFRYEPKILLKVSQILKLIQTPLAKRIVEEFRSFAKKHKSFDPSIFASTLPNELVEGYVDLILEDIKGLDEDTPEKLKKELKFIEKELRVLDIRDRLEKVSLEIGGLEKLKDTRMVKKKEEEFGELTKKLNKVERDNFKGIIL